MVMDLTTDGTQQAINTKICIKVKDQGQNVKIPELLRVLS